MEIVKSQIYNLLVFECLLQLSIKINSILESIFFQNFLKLMKKGHSYPLLIIVDNFNFDLLSRKSPRFNRKEQIDFCLFILFSRYFMCFAILYIIILVPKLWSHKTTRSIYILFVKVKQYFKDMV